MSGELGLEGEMREQIISYVQGALGLDLRGPSGESRIKISQKTDGKVLSLVFDDVEEVISRVDTDGQGFLQVNFEDGLKILLTKELVGFKPATFPGLEMDKLPRVVTTPDLVSVIEAIEETMHSEDTHQVEVDVLRRVFSSVLKGGEAAGFDMASERAWIQRMTKVQVKASA